MLRYALVFLFLAGPVLGQDPEPTPAPIPPVAAAIVAPKGVDGSGTRDAPFVFTVGAKGDLKLVGVTGKVKWVLSDAPADTEVLSDVRLWFATNAPKLYVVSASWVAGDEPGGAMCWFEIKGSGPSPPPNPVNVLAAELRTALVGTNAKTDAAKLHGMTSALADAVEANKFATYGQMHVAWKATQASNQWPAGVYPKMPDVMRLAIPTVDETTPIDTTAKASIVANLRILEKTAEDISNGK